jgi:hypothetical protein
VVGSNVNLILVGKQNEDWDNYQMSSMSSALSWAYGRCFRFCYKAEKLAFFICILQMRKLRLKEIK